MNIAEKCAIATTVFYNPDNENDMLRQKIALSTLRDACTQGYDVNIVYGLTKESFLECLRREGARLHPELIVRDGRRQMGYGRRQALQAALDSGRDVVAWTEPEKKGYIRELPKTILPILNREAVVVVPKRKSLKSYPIAQQHSERFVNTFWEEMTGIEMDIMFGPRTMDRRACSYFIDYECHGNRFGDKWESIFMPLIDIIKAGKKVISVEIDYRHPASQRRYEEGNLVMTMKRLEQLNCLVTHLYDYWHHKL